MEVKLKFRFSDLANDENALSIIETSIKKELEKNNNDINFNTDFIKVKIGYTVNHTISIGNKVISSFNQFFRLRNFFI